MYLSIAIAAGRNLAIFFEVIQFKCKPEINFENLDKYEHDIKKCHV